jgi:nicotinamide mononucleotide adenylyltransferase
VCLERDGVNVPKMIIESDLMHSHRHNILVVPQYVHNAISSTVVRLMLRRRMSIKYLVPDAVIRYLVANRLYVDDSLESKVGIFQQGRL